VEAEEEEEEAAVGRRKNEYEVNMMLLLRYNRRGRNSQRIRIRPLSQCGIVKDVSRDSRSKIVVSGNSIWVVGGKRRGEEEDGR
jgi:hypothetical protein